MKENIYDNLDFFNKYSEMSRSKDGLEGAGEWYELKKLLPDFKDKDVLDLGCGYGWHCTYAVENGAKSVIGVDISQRMLEVAKEKNTSDKITYIQNSIEDIQFDDNSFDIIISSLVFHYIEDYKHLINKISKMLKKGGHLIFTVEHPVFTAYGSQDWYYDENKEILHFPVDNYYYEGLRTATFLGEEVSKYHRTITTYIKELLNNDFIINDLVEPMPPKNMLDIPNMKDEMRRPMMLIISTTKQ